MRANLDRSKALAFGTLVDSYDTGRPQLGAEYVTATLHRLGRTPGRRHLDVGAGTGQLTGALLESAERVVAVEPSPPMAARLTARFAEAVTAGRLQVLVEPFESLPTDRLGVFDAVWSSDAWHWVDPDLGYPTAADLLAPGGSLITTWGFPVLTDPALKDRLNTLYRRVSPDLVRDAAHHLSDLTPLLDEGRREVDRSTRLRVVDHWIERHQADVTPEQYVQWQLSYAHIADLTVPARAALADAVHAELDAAAPGPVAVTTWRYTCAANRPPRVNTGLPRGSGPTQDGEHPTRLPSMDDAPIGDDPDPGGHVPSAKCGIGWGVCPVHGNTLIASGRRTRCRVPSCGRTWGYDRVTARCAEPVSHAVIDDDGDRVEVCTGHAHDCRQHLTGCAVTSITRPEPPARNPHTPRR